MKFCLQLKDRGSEYRTFKNKWFQYSFSPSPVMTIVERRRRIAFHLWPFYVLPNTLAMIIVFFCRLSHIKSKTVWMSTWKCVGLTSMSFRSNTVHVIPLRWGYKIFKKIQNTMDPWEYQNNRQPKLLYSIPVIPKDQPSPIRRESRDRPLQPQLRKAV